MYMYALEDNLEKAVRKLLKVFPQKTISGGREGGGGGREVGGGRGEANMFSVFFGRGVQGYNRINHVHVGRHPSFYELLPTCNQHSTSPYTTGTNVHLGLCDFCNGIM